MGSPSGFDVDHINGDRLDNRKTNLRVVTRSVNNMNSDRVWGASGYKGVGQHVTGSWYARLKVNGKVRSFGYYKTAEEANVARLLGEMEAFGIQPRRRKFFIDAGIIAE